MLFHCKKLNKTEKYLEDLNIENPWNIRVSKHRPFQIKISKSSLVEQIYLICSYFLIEKLVFKLLYAMLELVNSRNGLTVMGTEYT